MKASQTTMRATRRCLSTAADAATKSSFQIKNPAMRESILSGYKRLNGPLSLRSKAARLAYNTPIGLDEVFPLAHEIVKKYQSTQSAKAESLKEQLAQAGSSEEASKLKVELTKAQVRSQVDNPEVQYNFKIGQSDFREPVYRYLAEQKWKEYDQLVLMQRLESLKVIPDTMPTLDPKAKVELQFSGSVNKWLVPGATIPCAVASRPPLVTIQEFEEIKDDSLYTLVIVDPDTPDLARDSFKTTLKWAVANIPLSNVEHFVDTDKATELVPYLPPTPEKNSGIHRHAVWAFRQNNGKVAEVAQELIERDGFDIRKFADELGLQAVGAHIWRNKFDRTTDGVREKYGLGAGRVFARVRR